MTRGKLESFRTYFFRGLLAFLPIMLTIWILDAVIRVMDQAVTFLPKPMRLNQYLPWDFPGVGAVTTIGIIWLIGFIVTHFVSASLRSAWDQALRRIPLVRGIYTAVGQLVDAIFSEKSGKFSRVILFEYPRKGLYTLGLVTGVTEGEIRERTDDRVLNVFVPTTPNPTSGWYVVVPERDAVSLEMSVEEAFKLIISGGIVIPDRPPVGDPKEISESLEPAPRAVRELIDQSGAAGRIAGE